MQLVAAGILFAVVFPILAKERGSLVAVAGVMTAAYGYAGTMIILANENQILLLLVVLLTLYPVTTAFVLLYFAQWIRGLLELFP